MVKVVKVIAMMEMMVMVVLDGDNIQDESCQPLVPLL